MKAAARRGYFVSLKSQAFRLCNALSERYTACIIACLTLRVVLRPPLLLLLINANKGYLPYVFLQACRYKIYHACALNLRNKIDIEDNEQYFVLRESLGEEDFAIGFRKADKTLRDKVQEIISAMKADGTLGEISQKWFGSDITIVK